MNISTILFTKDDIESAKIVIEQASHISDDVVIIDSSSKETHEKLKNLCKKYGSMIKVKYAVPLGYPEPYMEYALSLTKNEWTLQLYAFCRLNKMIIGNVNRLLEDLTKYDVIKICRIAINAQDKPLDIDYFPYLFRKSSMHPTGIIHTTILPHEELKKMNVYIISSDFNVKHKVDYTDISRYGTNRNMKNYLRIQRFESRITYRKLYSEVSNTHSKISHFLKFYIFLKNKKSEEELTKTDYIIYYYSSLILATLYRMKYEMSNNIGLDFVTMFKINKKLFDETIEAYTVANSENQNQIDLDVQNEIEKEGGIINYLSIHSENDIERINAISEKKFLSGTELFEWLVMDKYYRLKKNNR